MTDLYSRMAAFKVINAETEVGHSWDRLRVRLWSAETAKFENHDRRGRPDRNEDEHTY